MPMAVVMIVIVIVVMVMVMVMLMIHLGFRIALHERFDHLAQGILVECQMAGEQAREAREDKRLADEAERALVRSGLVAVAYTAAERVGEELVHIGDGVGG